MVGKPIAFLGSTELLSLSLASADTLALARSYMCMSIILMERVDAVYCIEYSEKIIIEMEMEGC